jgi:amidophosphoribosyltransferase
MRISCPPISHPCFFGIDFPTREELAAGVQDIEAIRNFIGVDTLGYLSVDGLLAPLARPRDYCLACFSGVYPDSLEIPTRKRDLERGVLSCDD